MTPRDWQNFFGPDEFDVSEEEFRAMGCPVNPETVKANRLIREEIEKAVVVYRYHGSESDWRTRQCPSDTHSAKLICIEEIKPNKKEGE